MPVTIETTDEPIDLRTPHQGVTIDAESVEGQIRVSEPGSTAEPDTSEAIERAEKSDKIEKTEKSEQKERVERRERRERREPSELPEAPEPPSATHRVPPPPPPPAPPAPAPSPTPSPDPDEHGDAKTKRAFIKLHGGGPKITLRNERGDIIIR